MNNNAAEPLHHVLRQLRQPVALRELMANCLRHVYLKPDAQSLLPPLPDELTGQVKVSQLTAAGLRCLVYLPAEVPAGFVLYMHGGGFVFGVPEDMDYVARKLCFDNNLAVISIDYRLAPETPFPGAIEDCLKVLEWACAQANQFGFNSENLFLAGDSAGGNLAMAVALKCRELNIPVARLIALAPWLDMFCEQYASYNRLAPGGIVYDAAFIGFCRGAYTQYEEWKLPLVSPLYCQTGDLPASILIAGDADPLVDQVRVLEKKAADESSEHLRFVYYPGMPHCFYCLPGLFEQEVDCFKQISQFVCGKLGCSIA